VGNAGTVTGGSGNLTYVWLRTGTSSATLTGAAPTYPLNSDASNYSTPGTYYFNRYVKDNICNTTAAASGTYTLGVVLPGIAQPQGSCTYTEPAVVGTFASFPANYSASTYVSLMDGRDNRYYPVVKIGGRWIMARNLNYQTGLTWQANANQPATNTPSPQTGLIGHFWCPGGDPSVNAPTSTLASCDVWGALYSWETAMMVDGKWTSGAHSSSTWIEPVSYGASTTTGNYQNHARADNGATTGGRGICPPNWHVPTDGEWGDLLNSMETGLVDHNNGTGDLGFDAGSRGKSTCTAPNGGANATYINDTQTNWSYHVSAMGTDDYGLRILPSGLRWKDGGGFTRGRDSYLWSSSSADLDHAWARAWDFYNSTVARLEWPRFYGISVRCIRD
jgi:uncharacterized protein (TIGR02145 family)